jgi:hypothetical protein
LLVKQRQHLAFPDRGDQAVFDRDRRRHAARMLAETTLAEELPGLQDSDNRLLALAGDHRQLDPPLLDIEDRVRRFPLRVDLLVLVVFLNRFSGAGLRQKGFGIKRVLFDFAHGLSLPPTARDADWNQAMLGY